MAVTFTVSERRGPTTWYFEWTSDAAPPISYRIFIDGVLVETTTRASRVVMAIGGSIGFEVLDDLSDPIEVHPGGLLFTIQTDVDVAKYRIEQFVDAAWVTRRTFINVGESYFSHLTPVLADDTTHLFRIMPVNAAGIDGTPKEISAHVVRIPDVPDIEYTRDSGTGVVTVSEV